MKKRANLIGVLWLLASVAGAQQPREIQMSAVLMEQATDIANGAYRLIGNVRFEHGGAVMYCDSAYYYGQPRKSLEAFSRVHLVQGDSIDCYGDYLFYDENTKLAEIRRNVKLFGRNTELYTSELDFNVGTSTGYYTRHADIISGDNKLKSRKGYYYSRQEMYYFIDSVVLQNPDYTIFSDTLRYYTGTSVAYFYGPTEIIGDSLYIYCEDGWYNTQTDISMLKQNTLVKNKKQTIRGDSLYYERLSGYGKGYDNIELFDEEQNILLRGNRAIVHQQHDSALLTDNAQFIYITGDNDSVFVHADTLRATPDSAGNRQLRAFYGVRLYKSDLQGMCDSLFYSTSDSILRLFREPVLWSGENQLSAEYIEIWTRNRQIDQVHMQQLAFMISMVDSGKYNQIKGKNMTGFFKNNEPYKIVVKGNGQTVYYVKDDKENELMGVNVAQSSDLTIFLKDKKPENIRFYVKPSGTTYPLLMAPEEVLILKDFKWVDHLRPKSKWDIFR